MVDCNKMRRLIGVLFFAALASTSPAAFGEGKTNLDALLRDAITNNDLTLLKDAIAAGADVNTKEPGKYALYCTPLSWAVKAASMGPPDGLFAIQEREITKALVDAGANVNQTCDDGQTALSVAADSVSPMTIEILIAAGADVKHEDQFSATPLLKVLSAASTCTDLVNTCENFSKKDVFDSVSKLVDAGADVNFIQNFGGVGNYPLREAIRWNDEDIIFYLLKHGADVNPFVTHGQEVAIKSPPLFEAAKFSSPDVIRALISAGGDVNARYWSGSTPLMQASKYGRADIVRILLVAGAEINAHDLLFGDTALIFAAKNNQAEVVRTLISAGADVSVKNKKGDTALKIATRKKIKDVVQLLKDAGVR